ncbi:MULTISPECIES: pyrroloquinoline quinone biosynthesis protein PqqB [unclassified Bartonella]|uniref:pyrroloquinoline quinone biosynthesis protein PqqB n=1 Tax=unclassified Bartonella TaxID=2645622 RepID=UPI0021C96C84|nr:MULTISPECIES: pyrroloquinoline quinone biosynthesis protein PqqB [unclassified Bartonella]UXM95981.1 pyrroloquinoline quinone biosynthesis protein PqqB [Bartonella sp. HY329]UXN07118.1 pyrroloquinoline quinone biosynthesis protein PqqB [Bartonella sp. HY761]UXN10306.1 pyrroloquinoline quinone biosynthesis protein PqqB [Bartonella sp. HY328]
MFFKIIGSAAGGGFPQWNCNYPLSRNARTKNANYLPRTQSSLIASSDQKRWVLFNASPDLRQQINQTPELHPHADGELRNSPIAAVVLTNADVDHIAGLLTLRERQPFVLYATKRVMTVLNENPIFNVLDRDIVQRKVLPNSGLVTLHDCEGKSLNVEIEIFSVPGKVALFMEDPMQLNFGSQEGDTVALKIYEKDSDNSLLYIPGAASVTNLMKMKAGKADILLFDGTLYQDDEMVKAGLGPKTGARMGHISMSGELGSIAVWQDVAIKRKIFVHINNSNPVLDASSPERALVEKAGWEIAFDGMELAL